MCTTLLEEQNDFKVQKEEGTQGTMRAHRESAWISLDVCTQGRHARQMAHAHPHTPSQGHTHDHERGTHSHEGREYNGAYVATGRVEKARVKRVRTQEPVQWERAGRGG